MKATVRSVNSNDKMLFDDKERSQETKLKILTKSYLQELGEGISVRIRQRERAHADSEELAAKVRLR